MRFYLFEHLLENISNQLVKCLISYIAALLSDCRHSVLISLCIVFQNNRKLLWLGLGSNYVGADGTWALCQGLHDNSSLLWLGLGGNELGDRGALHLATLLQSKDCVVAAVQMPRKDLAIKLLKHKILTIMQHSLDLLHCKPTLF